MSAPTRAELSILTHLHLAFIAGIIAFIAAWRYARRGDVTWEMAIEGARIFDEDPPFFGWSVEARNGRRSRRVGDGRSPPLTRSSPMPCPTCHGWTHIHRANDSITACPRRGCSDPACEVCPDCKGTGTAKTTER